MRAIVDGVEIPEPEDGTDLVRQVDGELDMIWRADNQASHSWYAPTGKRWFYSCDEEPLSWAEILKDASDVYGLVSLRDQP